MFVHFELFSLRYSVTAARKWTGCSPAGRPPRRWQAATCWPRTSGAASSPLLCYRATKCDLVLWPLPSSYTWHNSKDFQALLADASKLPNLKELLQSPGDEDQWTWDLVSWILSSKVLTIHSAGKTEFEKIQQLTGAPHMPVPTPDFLFEIAYFEPANGKFYETKGERDLIYDFHSSRLENFHSIIHNDCTATWTRASSQLSWFSSHWFMLMMFLYLLLLMVSVINSSAFQHFWNPVKR